MHEGVDAGVIGLVCAGGVNQPACDVGDAPALVLGEESAFDQGADETRFIRQVLRGKFIPWGESPL